MNGFLAISIAGFLFVLACSGPACRSLVNPTEDEVLNDKRNRMVTAQIESRGIHDPAVLTAMRSVERHLFVPDAEKNHSYEDRALPIGLGQTISQPYVVAAMTQALDLKPDMKVLEIGTGSGYQAAIMAEMGAFVHSIEIVPELARRSRDLLKDLGYDKVTIIRGDGYQGLPDEAPFDRVMVTAAPPEVPQALLDQLATGGRMVLPVGVHSQDLIVIDKSRDGIERSSLFPVRFVPMVHGKER